MEIKWKKKTKSQFFGHSANMPNWYWRVFMHCHFMRKNVTWKSNLPFILLACDKKEFMIESNAEMIFSHRFSLDLQVALHGQRRIETGNSAVKHKHKHTDITRNPGETVYLLKWMHFAPTLLLFLLLVKCLQTNWKIMRKCAQARKIGTKKNRRNGIFLTLESGTRMA